MKKKNMESLTPEQQTEMIAEQTIYFSRYCPLLNKVVKVEGGLKEWEAEVKNLLS